MCPVADRVDAGDMRTRPLSVGGGWSDVGGGEENEVVRDLFDGVYGCLIGGAIGDALGAPVENWHYRDIRDAYGKVDTFMPQPARAIDGGSGQITDDSTLRHYLCLAIVRAGGRITPDDYAAVWLDTLNPIRLFVTERITLAKLRLGMSPWETGRGQPLADAAIMSIAPVGIINAGDPRQAYQDGFNIALINQDGIERDAAATMAAGVAVALLPGATVDEVIDVMTTHSSYELRRLVAMAGDLVDDSATVDDFAERFYATMLDTSFPVPPGEMWDKQRSVSPSSREVLPVVLAILRLCDGDVDRCLIEAASFGRDADTIASVIGGLAGALRGASAIRSTWIDQCEWANEGFFVEVEGDPHANFHRMARRLLVALSSQKRATERRLDTLNALIP